MMYNVKKHKKLVTISSVILAFFVLSGNSCSGPSEYDQRQQQNKSVQIKNSQEMQNLQEKLRRDEASKDKIGYVYLMTFGKFIGYYTIKGKISSSGSQLAPEDEIQCKTSSSESCQAVDGPQDDGTFGDDDPGVFFFTTDGAMVVTSLDYLYADQPIAAAIDVPKLN